jgi:hypothetical protein
MPVKRWLDGGDVSMKTRQLKWLFVTAPYLVALVSLLLGLPGFAAGSSMDLYETENSTPEGFHDGASGLISDPGACTAFGWAVDPDNRDVDVLIRVFVDDDEEPVASRLADDYGSDMEEHDICPGGTCRFTVSLWDLISHDVEHAIHVQAQDIDTDEWWDLTNTPMQLTCETPAEFNPFIWADPYAEYINGWDWPSSATIDLQIFLQEDSLLTDSQVADETGAVGFDLNSYGFYLEPDHRVVMATEGVVSRSECGAFGWASDFDDPDRVIDIQVLADGIPVATTQTESAEYYVDLWGLIDPMKVHEVSVQAYDVESDVWFDLNGTPRQLLCTGLPQGGNVSIVVETHFNTEEDSPFTASGAAVDEGLICPSGLVTDNEAHYSGPPNGSILNVQVEKLFTCDDDSGTFTLQLQVHIDPYMDRASWKVVGGTDAYSGLKGNGKLAGVPADYGVIDYYGGMLRTK